MDAQVAALAAATERLEDVRTQLELSRLADETAVAKAHAAVILTPDYEAAAKAANEAAAAYAAAAEAARAAEQAMHKRREAADSLLVAAAKAVVKSEAHASLEVAFADATRDVDRARSVIASARDVWANVQSRALKLPNGVSYELRRVVKVTKGGWTKDKLKTALELTAEQVAAADAACSKETVTVELARVV
jgi:hypothetical protein